MNMAYDTKEFLYEGNLKEEYLQTCKESTATTYRRVLMKVEIVEEELDKPLSKFDVKDFQYLMKQMKANNINTLASYTSVIVTYLEYLQANGIKIDVDLVSTFSLKGIIKFVDQEQYISYKSLNRVANSMINAQDSVVLRLIFEGVSGKNYSEISNLTKNDIDFENGILNLKNEVKDGVIVERKLKLRYAETIQDIKEAINQTEYYKGDGYSGSVPLHVNDYVVRISATTGESIVGGDKVGRAVIFRRIKVAEEKFKNDKFKAKLIQRSGMLDLAMDIVKDPDHINADEYRKIASVYNYRNFDNLRGFITKASLELYKEENK